MAEYISKEKIEQARKIDLLTYLREYKPYEIVKISGDNYTTKSHDSVRINNGLWYRFSTSEGGKSAIDYLIKVEKMSLQEAVKEVLSDTNIRISNTQPKEKTIKKQIIIPEKSKTNKEIIQYLINRGIDDEIIDYCIKNKFIYQENKTNNIVFVGYDDNKNIKYAGCRSTNYLRIMRDAKGSSKHYSFRLLSSIQNDSIHIFESAIDLLSYATLLKLKGYEWKNQNLISLAGVYQTSKNINESKVPITILNYLNKNPKTENIILHFDNDIAGRNATKSFVIALQDKYNMYDIPAPYGKDINDYLCYKLGLKNRFQIENYKRSKVHFNVL